MNGQMVLLLCIALSVMGSLIVILADAPQRTLSQASRAVLRSRVSGLSDKTNIAGRLLTLKRSVSYEEFKTEQIINSGTIFTFSFALLAVVTNSLSVALILSIAFALGTYFVLDKNLTYAIEKNRQQLESEFPALIEMMSLALSAGLTPAQAMFRISERASGVLALQFTQTVDEIRRGVPFHVALDGMGRRIDSLVIRRFIDALVIAVVRGAPLVDVLQRHALESRQSHKNQVLAKAGKAEISMMIPIVFLILPISILFALWPSLSTLNLFST